MSRTVYIRPLAGIEPIKARILFEGRTYVQVTYGLGTEEVINKNDPNAILAPDLAAYWAALATREKLGLTEAESQVEYHRNRIRAFEEMEEITLRGKDD